MSPVPGAGPSRGCNKTAGRHRIIFRETGPHLLHKLCARLARRVRIATNAAMKRPLITAIAVILICMAAVVPIACANHQPTSEGILSEPRKVGAPTDAERTTPEPTREAMLNRAIENFSVRITDVTYLAAIGRIAESEPGKLPDYIAARENHEQCLWDVLADARRHSSPERPVPTREHGYEPEAMAGWLADCFRGESASWADADQLDRAGWLEPIVAAAARAKSPVRHYQTIHPQATDNDQWLRMAETYGQCEKLITPHAESIAAINDPATVTKALSNAALEMDRCMAAVTNQEWPDSTPQPTESPSRDE